MLDIVHIFDFLERYSASTVDVEIWFQFPVPRVSHEIEPVVA